jgi:GDP-L-fucose synthase
MSFYRGRRVVVTGGGGFLGGHVITALLEAGATVRSATRRGSALPWPQVQVVAADLRRREECVVAVRGMDCVFHLAACGWGLGENMKRQPQLLTDNVLMNTSLLDAAHEAGVERYLFTSSSSVYPASAEVLMEDQPWDQPPHPSEACFGWSKRLGEVQAQAYHAHHGMKVAIVRPSNPYGPGDNFDAGTSHVIPALIRRALARETPFVVWGSGRAVRSFIHAQDVARAMLLALERHAVADPVNVAAEETTSIADLVHCVLRLTGFADADIVFDRTKPEGHPRKVMVVKKAADLLGFHAQTSLETGLAETIRWFRDRGPA